MGKRTTAEYKTIVAQNLSLDLTRGKPSPEQLNLSDALDGILKGNYQAEDGTDSRNYGGLDGLPEGKRLGADIMGEIGRASCRERVERRGGGRGGRGEDGSG